MLVIVFLHSFSKIQSSIMIIELIIIPLFIIYTICVKSRGRGASLCLLLCIHCWLYKCYQKMGWSGFSILEDMIVIVYINSSFICDLWGIWYDHCLSINRLPTSMVFSDKDICSSTTRMSKTNLCSYVFAYAPASLSLVVPTLSSITYKTYQLLFFVSFQ